MAEKKGNVVLIEAFIVLCLLFMLQYVVSGIADESASADGDEVFLLTLAQAQTNDDSVSHFEAVRIDGRTLLLDGASNCPSFPSPSAYDLITKNGELAPFDIKAFLNEDAKVSDPVQLQAFADAFAPNLHVATFKPGQSVGGPATSGWGVVITGKLSALRSSPLFVEAFACICRISKDAGQHVGFEYPHPLLTTVMVARNGSPTVTRLVGYYTEEMLKDGNRPDGLLFKTSMPIGGSPLRRYALSLTDKGSLTTEVFQNLGQPGLSGQIAGVR